MSVICWEIIIIVTAAVTVVVVETAVVVGLGEEQPWPAIASGGTLADSGGLSPHLTLAAPQENRIVLSEWNVQKRT